MGGRGQVFLLVVMMFTAGCAAMAAPPATRDDAGVAVTIPTAATPLWDDRQTTPHPAFGWPTLSWPATGPDVPAWWRPIPPASIPAHLSGIQLVARSPGTVREGAGIAVFGSLAIVPGFGTDSHVLDISDPAHPTLLSTIPGRHRGAATIAYPTGRLLVVFATDSNLPVWDVTDPRAPLLVTTLMTTSGSHKVAVVPGTPIVYNANSDGQGAKTDMFDLTVPEAPVKKVWANGYGCHHPYFWIDPANAKYRGICAGVQVTQLWDVTDPWNPSVIVNVPVHHGNPALPAVAASPVMFSHFAALSRDGRTLLVGDETGGGSLAACNVHVETSAATASGPLGDLFFYDVTDERHPALKGMFNPGAHFVVNPLQPFAGCTAHHGRMVPDPEGRRDLIAMAYYGAGVVLVDFTDASNPRLAAQWASGTNTWEVWYDQGWLFTGDLARGLDVLKFV